MKGKILKHTGDQTKAKSTTAFALISLQLPNAHDTHGFLYVVAMVGDLWAAASAYDFGRKLDLADRYINCETTKYLLQAGRIEEAEKIVVLFSKVC